MEDSKFVFLLMNLRTGRNLISYVFAYLFVSFTTGNSNAEVALGREQQLFAGDENWRGVTRGFCELIYDGKIWVDWYIRPR